MDRFIGWMLMINGASIAVAALTVIDGHSPSAFSLACAAVAVIAIGITVLLRN